MRHIRSFKAYVCHFNIQMNATTKIDNIAKKYFLGGFQKWVVGTLCKFPKFFKDVARIIKIARALKPMARK